MLLVCLDSSRNVRLRQTQVRLGQNPVSLGGSIDAGLHCTGDVVDHALGFTTGVKPGFTQAVGQPEMIVRGNAELSGFFEMFASFPPGLVRRIACFLAQEHVGAADKEVGGSFLLPRQPAFSQDLLRSGKGKLYIRIGRFQSRSRGRELLIDVAITGRPQVGLELPECDHGGNACQERGDLPQLSKSAAAARRESTGIPDGCFVRFLFAASPGHWLDT